jgi:hypothetical protein
MKSPSEQAPTDIPDVLSTTVARSPRHSCGPKFLVTSAAAERMVDVDRPSVAEQDGVVVDDGHVVGQIGRQALLRRACSLSGEQVVIFALRLGRALGRLAGGRAGAQSDNGGGKHEDTHVQSPWLHHAPITHEARVGIN